MVETVNFVVDGKTVTVERKVVEVSKYVRKLLQNLVDDNHSEGDSEEDKDSGSSMNAIDIPINNMSYETLEAVLRWCTRYYETHKEEVRVPEDKKYTRESGWSDNVMEDYQSNISEAVLDIWERDFLDVDPETLKQIILAANYLDIKPLLDATCKVIAEIFRGKSPNEILDAFGMLRSGK